MRGKGDDRTIYSNIYEYGWECFRMELLQEVDVKNKQELFKIEGDWIRKLDTFNNGLNQMISGRTKKQYYKENKKKMYEYFAMYRKKNRERINERQKKNTM